MAGYNPKKNPISSSKKRSDQRTDERFAAADAALEPDTATQKGEAPPPAAPEPPAEPPPKTPSRIVRTVSVSVYQADIDKMDDSANRLFMLERIKASRSVIARMAIKLVDQLEDDELLEAYRRSEGLD